MKANVVLKLKGCCAGEFTFTQPIICTLGRAADCMLRVPPADATTHVSRHHCRFDIDPPGICVRDLGSLNGTYLNGRIIGQRQQHQPDEDPAEPETAAYWLHDGDEVQAGDLLVRVSITPSAGDGVDAEPMLSAAE